jgi:hypothetical protein
LSYLANQTHTETNIDTDNRPDQSPTPSQSHTMSPSTTYHSGSESALPQSIHHLTAIHLPHPNHPYGIDPEGLPYITEHETNHWIGF